MSTIQFSKTSFFPAAVSLRQKQDYNQPASFCQLLFFRRCFLKEPLSDPPSQCFVPAEAANHTHLRLVSQLFFSRLLFLSKELRSPLATSPTVAEATDTTFLPCACQYFFLQLFFKVLPAAFAANLSHERDVISTTPPRISQPLFSVSSQLVDIRYLGEAALANLDDIFALSWNLQVFVTDFFTVYLYATLLDGTAPFAV